MACQASIEMWFLVEGCDKIHSRAPEVRVERYTENLRDRADRVDVAGAGAGGQFSDLVMRAHVAFENQLGAGAVIYLRKIFEMITFEVAEIAGISVLRENGRRRPFFEVLQEVNEERNIIPQRYSSDGYKLFGELSNIIHGDADETVALSKFRPCLQLVLGVVDEVKRDNEFAVAIDELGWAAENINEIAQKAGAA